MTDKPNNDLLWKQYELHIDLYKHYLELVIKFNVLYYAITGAILSFYFSQDNLDIIRFSLIFPVAMSLCFSIFFIYASRLVEVVREDVFGIRDQLGLFAAPEMRVLQILLFMSALLYTIVAISLTLIFFLRTS
jgi:hypothetical protein